ncbi:hypothetical protein Y032_0002g1056 [Ancylostoma ceylanicum]|nr:hypothetical protein Y032_0002g1056 [Ancylostoma ceylanicum]
MLHNAKSQHSSSCSIQHTCGSRKQKDRGSVMAPHRAASPPNEKDRGSVMAPSRAASPPDGKVDECDEWTTMLR